MVDHLIRVEVFELQNALLPGSVTLSPFVKVRVYGEEKVTAYHEDSTSCSFNCFFSFLKRLSPQDIENGHIEIEVLARHMVGTTTLGKLAFSVAKILNSPRHFFPKTWMPVSLLEDPTQLRGALRISCGVYENFHEMPGSVVDIAWLDNTWASRLATSPSFDDYRWAMMNFSVLKADNVSKPLQAEGIRPYVCVTFNTITLRTKVKGRQICPLWNEELKFPLSHPCRCEQILVELYSEYLYDRRIAWGTFELTPILNGDMAPLWLDLYSSNDTLEEPMYESSDPRSWFYVGRLLVAASIQRQKHPIAGTYHISLQLVEPQVETFELWVDVFEVCFGLEKTPDEALVMIQVGCEELCLRSTQRSGNGHFLWKSAGRGELLLHLPTTAGEIPPHHDLVVFVLYRCKRGSWETYMVRRISLSSIHGKTPECLPLWYDGLSVQPHNENGSFLAGLILVPQTAAFTRPPRYTYKLRPHRFRGTLNQVQRLPITVAALPNAYVRIALGGQYITSTRFTKTTNPKWEEEVNTVVYLPSQTTLMPNVRISIIDDQGDVNTTLGSVCLSASELAEPRDWTTKPDSFRCALGTDIKKYTTMNFIKLLAAFEITPVKIGMAPARPITSNPEMTLCTIRLFFVGIRSSHPRMAKITPQIRVSFGRNPVTNQPTWEKWTEVGVKHSEGNYNFLEQMVFQAPIPVDRCYDASIDIEVLNMDASPETLTDLTQTLGNMMSEWTFGVAAATPTTPSAIAWGTLNLHDYVPSKSKTVRISPFPTESNTVHDVDKHKPCVPEGKLGRKEEMALLERKLDKPFGLCEVLENLESLNVYKFERNRFYSTSVATPEEKMRQFKTVQMTRTSKFVMRKSEVEDDIKDSLPYTRIPLFSGTTDTTQVPLGTVKMVCVVEGEAQFKTDGESWSEKAWEGKVRTLQGMYDKASGSVVNVYILDGEHLVPHNPQTDTNTFLWLKFPGSKVNASYNIKDDFSLRKAFPKPEYNRRYVIEKVSFPEHSTLEICIMEKGSTMLALESETEIGKTHIDLEDRWISQKYRDAMMRKSTNDPILVETRRLYRDDFRIARCHLNMWVEVLSSEDRAKYPAEALNSGEAKAYQVQCCIYRVKILDLTENKGMHLYVTGTMVDDSGTAQTETTDTHYGEYQGRGTFNWRFLFNVKIPCQNTVATFKVWDSSVVTGGLADEPFANALIDLGADFEAIRENERIGGEPDLPAKGWIDMTNASGVRAQMEISMRIQNEELYTTAPVGRGREKENRDPYLDDTDPHLLDHRRYLANSVAAVMMSSAFKPTDGKMACCACCCCLILLVLGISLYVQVMI